MAKISKLNLISAANSGAAMPVLDRTAEPNEEGEYPPLLGIDGKPSTLVLLGLDSTEARRLSFATKAAFQNRILARVTGQKKSVVVTAEDVAQQQEADLDLLCALTIGWSGFEDDQDQPVPFTEDAVRQLYASNPDIMAQALEFIGERSNFLPS